MYAVIKTGGKQHKVEAGDVIEVEYMDVDPGSAVEFEPIMVRDDAGKPHVGKGLERARVVAMLVGDTRDDKVKVFKYRPKSGYQRTQGHRQRKTVLEVQEIALGDTVVRKEAAEPEKEPADEKAPAKKTAKKAAARKAAAKKTPAKKTGTKKPAARKTPARKSSSKKAAAKKSSSKKPSS